MSMGHENTRTDRPTFRRLERWLKAEKLRAESQRADCLE